MFPLSVRLTVIPRSHQMFLSQKSAKSLEELFDTLRSVFHQHVLLYTKGHDPFIHEKICNMPCSSFGGIYGFFNF